jgi:poly(3-hydroxybutyrate) depolymerase
MGTKKQTADGWSATAGKDNAMATGANPPPSISPAWVDFDGERLPIVENSVLVKPFCTLTEYSHKGSRNLPSVLVVSPISGHTCLLLRDMIIGLAGHYRTYVMNWTNARDVPFSAGTFGFDDNIGYIGEMARFVGPGATVIALCQSVVPALCAGAIPPPEHRMRALVLIGGPVDPLANPTRVVGLLRWHNLDWFRSSVLQEVRGDFIGKGRRVYPASTQLGILNAYLARHLFQHGELSKKLQGDDGLDPVGFPFLTAYTTLFDLPEEIFLENIDRVFHRRLINTGGMRLKGELIDPSKLSQTALLTIEGELDDIAAPGQTRAAHGLCPNIPDAARHHITVEQCGHFSLFHGTVWRSQILPQIVEFLGSVEISGRPTLAD